MNAVPRSSQNNAEFTAFLAFSQHSQGEQLDSWLARVEKQGVSELKSFAQGLQKDYDAVKAGLTLPWGQGPVEGHVHRLKPLKRQAYGRKLPDAPPAGAAARVAIASLGGIILNHQKFGRPSTIRVNILVSL